MCRIYNDLASAERDNAEGNLNCVHFPEFDQEGSLAARKKAVLEVLSFKTSGFAKCVREASSGGGCCQEKRHGGSETR